MHAEHSLATLAHHCEWTPPKRGVSSSGSGRFQVPKSLKCPTNVQVAVVAVALAAAAESASQTAPARTFEVNSEPRKLWRMTELFVLASFSRRLKGQWGMASGCRRLSAVESKPASDGRIKTSHFFSLNRLTMFWKSFLFGKSVQYLLMSSRCPR